MKSVDVVVQGDKSGERLDVFLTTVGLDLSRRRIRQIIDVGGVYVNKRRIRVASRQVFQGDRVRVEYSEAALTKLTTEKIVLAPSDLLYAHGGIYALNKPPGLPSQATKDQSVQHALPCLQVLLKSTGQPQQGPLILVHRLDKETSGVLLIADGATKATWLTEAFRQRTIKKQYLALCYGIPKEDEFTERSPLSEIDKKTGHVRAVRAGGKSAVTHFKCLAKNSELGISLLACRPETGRSHQIRVHLELNGLPIIGDKRYGSGQRRHLPPDLAELTAVHHFLHAESLEFKASEAGSSVKVVAPLPERMQSFLAKVGFQLEAERR